MLRLTADSPRLTYAERRSYQVCFALRTKSRPRISEAMRENFEGGLRISGLQPLFREMLPPTGTEPSNVTEPTNYGRGPCLYSALNSRFLSDCELPNPSRDTYFPPEANLSRRFLIYYNFFHREIRKDAKQFPREFGDAA